MVIKLVVKMVKAEMGSVKIQPRKAGGFMITLPKAIVRGLELNGNEKMKVFVDFEKREVIYKLEEKD